MCSCNLKLPLPSIDHAKAYKGIFYTNFQAESLDFHMYNYMMIECVALNREGIALEITTKSSTTIQDNRIEDSQYVWSSRCQPMSAFATEELCYWRHKHIKTL